MPTRERPCLEHMQHCPGLLVAFSLSLVSFKTGGHKPETKLRTSAAQARGTFTPAAQVLSWSFGQLRTPVNCRGFFGLLFSYPFGLFIPRVLDT